MLRRSFLNLIGCAVVAPSLPVRKHPSNCVMIESTPRRSIDFFKQLETTEQYKDVAFAGTVGEYGTISGVRWMS